MITGAIKTEVKEMRDMNRIRLGLVGCGGMMKNHMSGVQLVETVEVTALCDVIRSRAEDVATLFPKAFITTDYREMVDKVDAVLVALPHDLHYECGLFFARKKKHILMEKPLCNTEEECVRLIKACEDEGVTLMCAYPVRYWQGIVKLKELVDSGAYGQPFQMSIWTEQLTCPSELGWSATARLGGGQFFSHGCHYVDLILWFMGNPVKGIHMGTNLGTPWMLREGTSAAIITFESGAIGYLGGTWGARGTRLGYDFQIHTEKGMLEYDHYAGLVRLYDRTDVHIPGQFADQTCTVLWDRGKDMNKETQHEIRHFADCVLNGKKPLTDGHSALQGLRVIWKLYDAEQHNTVADLRGLGLE